MSISSIDSTEFRIESDFHARNKEQVCDKRCPWLRVKFSGFWKYCEAYGSILAYKGAAYGALISSLVVTIFNEYEGGCKYPYLSEVARSGLGWLSFFIGTTIGCIPWIIFSFDYYRTFMLLSMSIKTKTSKWLYICMQKIVLLFNIISAVGMNGTAYFDMGNYPMTHEICVILFAVPLNILFIINYVDMIRVVKQSNIKYMSFKLFLLIGSLGGIILFTLLGRIEICKSVVMTIEECLKETSENVCFDYIDSFNDGLTTLRYYPRCHVMHFWRGFAEFLAVLCSAEYLLCLYCDRNTARLKLFKDYGILSTNSYVVKELSKEDEELKNQMTPHTLEWISI